MIDLDDLDRELLKKIRTAVADDDHLGSVKEALDGDDVSEACELLLRYVDALDGAA